MLLLSSLQEGDCGSPVTSHSCLWQKGTCPAEGTEGGEPLEGPLPSEEAVPPDFLHGQWPQGLGRLTLRHKELVRLPHPAALPPLPEMPAGPFLSDLPCARLDPARGPEAQRAECTVCQAQSSGFQVHEHGTLGPPGIRTHGVTVPAEEPEAQEA